MCKRRAILNHCTSLLSIIKTIVIIIICIFNIMLTGISTYSIKMITQRKTCAYAVVMPVTLAFVKSNLQYAFLKSSKDFIN